MSIKPKIIIILGPTASGKSDLAVEIAKKLALSKIEGLNGAEVISADSRQIYKGLDLGSGKITKKEMGGIKHHLLDVTSPKKTFTVAQYQKLAQKALQKIIKGDKIPIICGGTGLYIDSLIHSWKFPEVPPQPKLRKKLEKLTTEKLFEKLNKMDSRRAKNIDKHNRRRLIRALEIVITTKIPVPMFTIPEIVNFDVLKIGVKKSKQELKKAIAKRLYKRLKQGMVAEIKNLRRHGLSWKKLDDFGLEYRFISRYLRELALIDADPTLNSSEKKKVATKAKQTMEESIIKESIKYAKRQMTWFKRDLKIIWISKKSEAVKLAKNFLKYSL